MPNCVFCDIVARKAPATYVYSLDHVIGIVPINPVTPGHVIFIPSAHVEDFTSLPWVSGKVMQAAAAYWNLFGKDGAVNLITSKGVEATQSVFHLHVHLVPRHKDDGLTLPWTGQKESSK